MDAYLCELCERAVARDEAVWVEVTFKRRSDEEKYAIVREQPAGWFHARCREKLTFRLRIGNFPRSS